MSLQTLCHSTRIHTVASDYSADISVVPACFTHFSQALSVIDRQEREELKRIEVLMRQSVSENKFVALTAKEKAALPEDKKFDKRFIETQLKWKVRSIGARELGGGVVELFVLHHGAQLTGSMLNLRSRSAR